MKLLLLAAAGLLTAAAPAPTAAPRSRTFRLTCRATVPAPPAGTKALDVWLPVPHPDKSQDVRELALEASQAGAAVPYTLETDQYGNHVLHLRVAAGKAFKAGQTFNLDHLGKQLDKVPAASIAPLTVTLTALVTRREHLNLSATDDHAPAETEAADPNLARWLAPDRLVPLDEKIRALAQEVVDKAHATTPLAKARAIYEHVVGTMKYDKTGEGWGRGDIYYACDARRGNCTDFHAVFIGYCRAQGIPARFSIGLPLPAGRGAGGAVEIKGYHCWAEFFTTETGWVPVDASEAAKDPARYGYFFGAHDENRVEFTRGRDLTLRPAQAGPPLNYFVYPYAEADGRPLEVAHTYQFVDEAASAELTQPARSKAMKLLFVYNADSGPLNGFKDLLHKTFAPDTYECALCAKTYEFTGMKPEWKQAVAALPLPSEFLHRDEFRQAYPALSGQALPAAFSLDASGQLTPFISAPEMNTLDLKALIALARQRAQALVAAQ